MKFKKKTNKQKYLCKDKKKRSVKKQGICGLFAIARAIDIDIKTQKDAEEFRNTCIEKKCVDRKKNWIGGTTEEERMKICLFHGYKMSAIFNDVIERAKKNQKSVGVDKLLKQSEIFKTKLKMILTVNDHCLYLETNKTKKKMYLMDQGRKKMKLSEENKSSWFEHILRQRVKSLYVVEKNNRPA